MAQEAQIIDIAEPMQEREKKDGSGTYTAMRVTIKLPDGALETIISFDEKKVGEVVSVEKNGKYWNIVKPARSYDKPKAGSPSQTDVMQSLRFLYTVMQSIDSKVDAIVKELSLEVKAPDISAAVTAAILDNTPAEPTTGIDKFRQARQQTGLISEPEVVLDDIDDKPIDLSEIPF